MLSTIIQDGIGDDTSCHLQTIADIVVATQDDISKYDEEALFDTVKLNLYKIGSVYKALQLCKLAKQRAKWSIIVGCEEEKCCETNDTFIADLSVGIGAGQLNAGGLFSGEFLVKYNRIMEINREDASIPYCGKKFR